MNIGVRDKELSERQMEILKALAQTDKAVYGSELARMFGITQMTVSASIGTLASKGLVADAPDEDKGNKRLIRLTDKGAMYAVYYCGVDYRKIVELHPYLEDLSSAELKRNWSKFIQYNVMDIFARVLAEVSIRNDLFNQLGEWLLDPHGEYFHRYKSWFRPIVTNMTLEFIERWRESELTPSEFEDRLTWWIRYVTGNMFTQGEVVRELVQYSTR